MDEQMREKVKNKADRLIAEFYDSVAEKDWAMWGGEAVDVLERLTAALSQPAAAGNAELLDALRGIERMSKDASKGPAHVAKVALSMMADIAADAIVKATP